MEKRRKSASLLPVGVFLVFYLGLGILFEYIMKIPMGFYNVPIVVAFLAALLVACLQNRKVGFDEKLEIMGRGIGFQMKRGQKVPVEKVEKIFRIKSQSIAGQLKELLAKMPLEQVQISNEIISYAKKTMKLKLNQSIYVTLTDHISFAISRCKKGIHLENALLWEIKRFYPQEFELGRYAVELVKKRLDVEMPEDEAGFIALHFVNAEYGTDIRDAVRFPNQMKEILGIVADELGIEMDEGSLHYERFLTHVKFLLQRIYRKELLEEEENEITEMMQRKYPKEYSCSRKVADYIEQTADCKLSGEEVLYLTLHIRRVAMADSEDE